MIARINKRLRRGVAQARPRRPSFRERYQEIELRRAAMLKRINGFDERARSHPAYRSALTLLNQTFRKARVGQRVAILQSAEWLIDVLEQLTLII